MVREPADPWREIHERGDADLALAFGYLFWPVFVERRGCVLIEHRADDAAVAQCIEDCDGDLQRVEARLNRVQIRSEMFTEDSPSEDEILMDVARLMDRTWKAAIAEQFPGREFWIELHGLLIVAPGQWMSKLAQPEHRLRARWVLVDGAERVPPTSRRS